MAWWKREHSGLIPLPDKKGVPKGVWTKCGGCGEILTDAVVRENLNVCPRCHFHHRLETRARLESLTDPGSFREIGGAVEPVDALVFSDSRKYSERIETTKKKSGFNEAILGGMATLDDQPVGIAVMVFEYMGGSMGSVVGERLTRVFEAATAQRCAAIVCSASGGARMQEGILSLMQMAKTTAALHRHREAQLPYISILCHPTTGGVAASYAMLGDVNIAEPGALIGFAGPRVIEQTIRQKLPKGFQRAEFLLEHGMVDMVVPRTELRQRVSDLVKMLTSRPLA